MTVAGLRKTSEEKVGLADIYSDESLEVISQVIVGAKQERDREWGAVLNRAKACFCNAKGSSDKPCPVCTAIASLLGLPGQVFGALALVTERSR